MQEQRSTLYLKLMPIMVGMLVGWSGTGAFRGVVFGVELHLTLPPQARCKNSWGNKTLTLSAAVRKFWRAQIKVTVPGKKKILCTPLVSSS